MNAVFRTAISVACVLLLSACASTHEMAARQSPPPEPRQQQTIEDDAAYIAYVERIAKRRGINLTWVNPPKKRVVASK